MRHLCIKTLSICEKHSEHWNHDCKQNNFEFLHFLEFQRPRLKNVKEMVFKTRMDLNAYFRYFTFKKIKVQVNKNKFCISNSSIFLISEFKMFRMVLTIAWFIICLARSSISWQLNLGWEKHFSINWVKVILIKTLSICQKHSGHWNHDLFFIHLLMVCLKSQ